jgi:hypothetical protein
VIERRLDEMNDASPRFAEAQTGAPLLSSTEEGTVSLTELTRRTGELSGWLTEEGLRGTTAGELFEGYCRRLSAMDVVIMRAYVSTQTLHPNGLATATHGDGNSVRCVSSNLPAVQFRTSG